jgi:iron complex transport system substrate-binding protein
VRICSLIPSATEIVAELGAVDSLVGVSAECKWPPAVVGKPVVSAARIELSSLTSREIDRVVRESVHDGGSLYAVDAELIDALAPDLIVTQDLCTVCAVSSGELATACPIGAEVISLDPRTLADVADSVRVLGAALGEPARADGIVAAMWAAVDEVEHAVAGRGRRRMFFAEWIDPPFCAGHWLPEMIERAGGVDVLGRAGHPSYATTWERVLESGPELVVIGPCGFDAEEAAVRSAGLELPCRAVAVDADSYYSRPAPRLAEGVRQLGHLLHPEVVPDPGLPALELPAAAAVVGRRARVDGAGARTASPLWRSRRGSVWTTP